MNKLMIILSIAAATFLAFVGGVLVGEYEVNPFYTLLKPTFTLADTCFDRPLDSKLFINSHLWSPARTSKKGLLGRNDSRSFGGYTLLSSGHDQSALLYDEAGNVLHRWHLPFREAWPTAPQVEDPVEPSLIYWSALHLYANGDLLATYQADGDDRGYGLVKMDRDSKPIWTCDDRVGGTFAVGADGRVYAIVRSIRNEPIEDVPQIICPYIDDEIVTLTPEGKEIGRFSLLKRLHEKVGGKFLSSLDPDPSSLLGSVSVDLVTSEMARKLPTVEAGNLLVSMSNAGLLVIVDQVDGSVKWVTQGPWRRQNTARVTKDGNIVVFDNRGLEGRGMGSGVLVLDPSDRNVVWMYPGDARHPLFSKRWSSVQELPNSNFLVTESQAGRVFEITRDKQIVWEWINPYRSGVNGKYIAAVWDGLRYAKDDIDFEFNKGD